MTDKPRPGGYLDRSALARAVSSHRALVEVVETLIDEEQMSRLRLAQLLQRAGLHLAIQRDALADMEAIRRGKIGEL